MNEIELNAEEYLNQLKIGNKSSFTIAVYKKDIFKFINFFNIKSLSKLENLNHSDFMKFISSLSNLKPSSIDGLIRSINAWFAWLIYNDKISENKFVTLRFGKRKFTNTEKKVVFTLSDEECKRMISSTRTEQEKFMLALMLMTSIRRGEVVNIKLSDINKNKILIHGKGNKERVITLQKDLCEMMDNYLSNRKSDSEYLFFGERGIQRDLNKKLTTTSVNNRVKDAGVRAGLPKERLEKLHAHTTRATAITRIIRTPYMGLNIAMKIAGHSSISVTQKYNGTNQDDIERAMLAQETLL
jgi:integrase/recombinase XerD